MRRTQIWCHPLVHIRSNLVLSKVHQFPIAKVWSCSPDLEIMTHVFAPCHWLDVFLQLVWILFSFPGRYKGICYVWADVLDPLNTGEHMSSAHISLLPVSKCSHLHGQDASSVRLFFRNIYWLVPLKHMWCRPMDHARRQFVFSKVCCLCMGKDWAFCHLIWSSWISSRWRLRKRS